MRPPERDASDGIGKNEAKTREQASTSTSWSVFPFIYTATYMCIALVVSHLSSSTFQAPDR